MFALLIALLAVWLTYREIKLARDGVEASGTVVDKVRGGRNKHFTVRFTTGAGRQVRADVNDNDWNGGMPRVGEVVRIRYDPSNPGWAVDARHDTATRAVLPAVLWTGGLIFGIWAFRRRRRPSGPATR